VNTVWHQSQIGAGKALFQVGDTGGRGQFCEVLVQYGFLDLPAQQLVSEDAP
jgi:hypothetical protein